MGVVESRLARALQLYRETAPVPIIVETITFPTTADIDELKRYGMRVTSISRVLPYISGVVRADGVQSLAGLPFVKVVSLSEEVKVL